MTVISRILSYLEPRDLACFAQTSTTNRDHVQRYLNSLPTHTKTTWHITQCDKGLPADLALKTQSFAIPIFISKFHPEPLYMELDCSFLKLRNLCFLFLPRYFPLPLKLDFPLNQKHDLNDSNIVISVLNQSPSLDNKTIAPATLLAHLERFLDGAIQNKIEPIATSPVTLLVPLIQSIPVLDDRFHWLENLLCTLLAKNRNQDLAILANNIPWLLQETIELGSFSNPSPPSRALVAENLVTIPDQDSLYIQAIRAIISSPNCLLAAPCALYFAQAILDKNQNSLMLAEIVASILKFALTAPLMTAQIISISAILTKLFQENPEVTTDCVLREYSNFVSSGQIDPFLLKTITSWVHAHVSPLLSSYTLIDLELATKAIDILETTPDRNTQMNGLKKIVNSIYISAIEDSFLATRHLYLQEILLKIIKITPDVVYKEFIGLQKQARWYPLNWPIFQEYLGTWITETCPTLSLNTYF